MHERNDKFESKSCRFYRISSDADSISVNLTLREFFSKQLQNNTSGLESRISSALLTVQLQTSSANIPLDRIIGSFSGGQQARLLFAAALILDPDILLLDEPTNNLDKAGIDFLTQYIQETPKTCVVISHDDEFLNSFSDSVLYLDLHAKKVEQYEGDYHTVKTEILKRIQRENAENARVIREAQSKKDQANKFANKGGGMRKVAKKLREDAVELENLKVTVRKEDVALKPFNIPLQVASMQQLQSRDMVTIRKVVLPGNQPSRSLKTGCIVLHKQSHLQIVGPNGSGKSTLLDAIYNSWRPQSRQQEQEGDVEVNRNAMVGYYRQDFRNLDNSSSVLQCLEKASDGKHTIQDVHRIAASFLLKGSLVKQSVGTLSEGQKGLLSLACLVLQQPAILLMDEPTNHINFRHLPAIAKALSEFEGVLIVVSHDMEFMSRIRIDKHLHVLDDIMWWRKIS